MLEKTHKTPLDYKIQPVNPEGNEPWIFIGRADSEAPILWPPDAKSWLIERDPAAGKDWRQEEKGMTEDEMVGWHHRLKGHEFEPTLGDSEGQGSLACCSPWVAKSQTWLSNWTSAIYRFTKGYPKSWRRRWGPQHHWMNPFSFTAHSWSPTDQSSIFFF